MSTDTKTGNDLLNFESKKKKKKTVIPAPDELDSSKGGDPIPDLDFGKKKKKKSKLVLDEEMLAADSDATAKNETSDKKDVDQLASQLGSTTMTDFSTAKKKKKKTKLTETNADVVGDGEKEADSTVINADQLARVADVSGFTYDQLLTRVFAQIEAHNPELVSDQRKRRRLVLAPPEMARVGTKKTSFVNYDRICRSMNRDLNHLQLYLQSELGTFGSIVANNALLLRGRYTAKHMEPLLINYCRQYVLCSTCQSSETELCKDSRLLFLNCNRCGSRVTVKNVTSGYQAVTKKRAALRAKM